jgi:glycosyltransferase involved in cell wall biosynthesis
MRVLFVSDFTLDQRQGGAQVSNSFILKRGLQLGHQITEHDHTSSVVNFLSSYDLLVSSNLEAISQRSPATLDFITQHPNHVRLEHDSCSYLPNDERQKLFESSQKNFFLSEFHLSFFQQLYGDYFKNIHIVYDPIDTAVFKPAKLPLKYDIVYCGYLHHLKGLNNLVEFAQENPERQISIFGWGDRPYDNLWEGSPNITFHGAKSHNEIASIFQQSKAVYHFPIVNEPFCRMIGEALLCGVEEILGNTDKLGSYLEFQKVGYDQFKNECENAAEKFWDKATA